MHNFSTILFILFEASKCCMDIDDRTCTCCPLYRFRSHLSDFFCAPKDLGCDYLRHLCIEFLYHTAFPDGFASLTGVLNIPLEDKEWTCSEFDLQEL